MTEPIPIAYLTARYPPARSSGTYRVEAVMEYLPEFGFTPTAVTTPVAWVAEQSGARTAATVPARESSVVRPAAPSDKTLLALSRIPGLRKLVRAMLVPDTLVPWARQIPSRVAGSLEGVRLVYATGPPFSVHIAAHRLGELLGVPVVQEVRDPPSFQRSNRDRSALYDRRMFRFERRYLGAASQVIVVTPRTRTRLLELHPVLDPERVHVVTNGYPIVDVEPAAAGRRSDAFTAVYVGSFHGGTKRRPDGTPEVLLPALQALPGPAQLRLVGPLRTGQRERLAAWPEGLVESVGHLPRELALAEIAAADVAVIVAEDDPWWIGRKAFEYLAYAKRVLGIVPDGDTADLLRQSAKSVAVPLRDEEELRLAVSGLYDDWRSGRQPSGDEPAVPSDRDCVEAIAGVLRRALGQGSNTST